MSFNGFSLVARLIPICVNFRHIYTGELPKSETFTQDLCFEMYEAAQKYEFKVTIDALIWRMIKESKIEKHEQFLSYLNFALKHYIIEVLNYFQTILERDADKALFSEAFLRVHPRVLNWIYALNDLNINEIDLIRIAEKYKAFHQEAGRHAISAQIQPAINHIRFLSMTEDQINSTSFLSADEKKCLIMADKSVPMYLSRRRFGRCNNLINIICDDEHWKKLYDENKIKLGSHKGKMYLVTEDRKVVCIVEDSGNVVPCNFQELTPIKDIEEDSSKTKKVCAGIQQSVLYYKENKQILVNKKRGGNKSGKENDNNNEETPTVLFGKLSLKKH